MRSLRCGVNVSRTKRFSGSVRTCLIGQLALRCRGWANEILSSIDALFWLLMYIRVLSGTKMAMASTSSGEGINRSLVSAQDRLTVLYPAVNEDETPLPRSWSPKDKYSYIVLSQNNLRVHYKGSYSCVVGFTSLGWIPFSHWPIMAYLRRWESFHVSGMNQL